MTVQKALKKEMVDYDKYKVKKRSESLQKETFDKIYNSFTENEIEDIISMRFQCISIPDIAFEYNTSNIVITLLLRRVMPEYMEYGPEKRAFKYTEW